MESVVGVLEGDERKTFGKTKIKTTKQKINKPAATIAIVPFSRRITHMKIDYNSLLTSSLIQWQSWQQQCRMVWMVVCWLLPPLPPDAMSISTRA